MCAHVHASLLHVHRHKASSRSKRSDNYCTMPVSERIFLGGGGGGLCYIQDYKSTGSKKTMQGQWNAQGNKSHDWTIAQIGTITNVRWPHHGLADTIRCLEPVYVIGMETREENKCCGLMLTQPLVENQGHSPTLSVSSLVEGGVGQSMTSQVCTFIGFNMGECTCTHIRLCTLVC